MSSFDRELREELCEVQRLPRGGAAQPCPWPEHVVPARTDKLRRPAHAFYAVHFGFGGDEALKKGLQGALGHTMLWRSLFAKSNGRPLRDRGTVGFRPGSADGTDGDDLSCTFQAWGGTLCSRDHASAGHTLEGIRRDLAVALSAVPSITAPGPPATVVCVVVNRDALLYSGERVRHSPDAPARGITRTREVQGSALKLDLQVATGSRSRALANCYPRSGNIVLRRCTSYVDVAVACRWLDIFFARACCGEALDACADRASALLWPAAGVSWGEVFEAQFRLDPHPFSQRPAQAADAVVLGRACGPFRHPGRA